MTPRGAEPALPSPRRETEREAIRAALRERPLTLRELSARVGIAEKAVPLHLEHVARSARARGETFRVAPARCAKCGFSFGGRSRLTTPSRCPACASERVESPRFSLAGHG
jgi:predicted Zn-ribbon and HTH transcriptional regulator